MDDIEWEHVPVEFKNASFFEKLRVVAFRKALPDSIFSNAPKFGHELLRPRISLRSFLISVFLLGLFFGTIFPSLSRQQAEQRGIDGLRSIYGEYDLSLYFDYEIGQIRGRAEPNGPKWIRTIAGEHVFSTVTHVFTHGQDEREFAIVKDHLDNFSNLESLHGSNWIGLTSTEFFSRYHKLRTLCLKYCKDLEDLAGLSTLSRLEYLCVTSCEVRTVEPLLNMSQLRSIILTGCSELRDVELLGQLPQLRALFLGECTRVKSFDFLKHLPKLEALQCSAGDHVDSFDVNLLSKHNDLELLWLSGFDEIRNIESLSKYPELRAIKFVDCSGRLPGLRKLLQKDPRGAKKIMLRNCPHVSQEVLMEIDKRNVELEPIQISLD